jgi:hypothetical protein
MAIADAMAYARRMAAPAAPERNRKRLLVAAIGVATISYASSQGCEPQPTMTSTSGNLVPPPADANPLPPARDAELPSSGNLLPPPPRDAGPPQDAAPDALPTSGNLVPPPPREKR